MSERSTLEDVRPLGDGPRSVLARRIGTVALALVLLAALGGFLGNRVTTESAPAQGYTLTVTAATTARPGQDVPWQVRVTNPEGFGPEITIAVTAAYLEIYETQGFHPEPSETTRDGEWLYLTFDAPSGSTFVLDYDAYIQPNANLGRSGAVALVVDDARIAEVPIRTVLFP
ncbi:hypothetical protein EXU48_10330 [Occultella glacieicola]|uniref:Uncharacterized protein n=1 Tax=Occultella glacieicola TaxID=2518684 RepID=A0ABY2E2L3_9MICO|nr:hypothetical protein [Occultella glacieicola]TDE93868.1 hypothetical protein EXU48_10330 [Occultella glacieicola]